MNTSVAPPYTAASVKRHIALQEGMNVKGAQLFLQLLRSAECKDDDAVDVASPNGAGCSPKSPIAVVFAAGSAIPEFVDKKWTEFVVNTSSR